MPFTISASTHTPFLISLSLVCFYLGNSSIFKVLLFSNNCSFSWIYTDILFHFVCEFILEAYLSYTHSSSAVPFDGADVNMPLNIKLQRHNVYWLLLWDRNVYSTWNGGKIVFTLKCYIVLKKKKKIAFIFDVLESDLFLIIQVLSSNFAMSILGILVLYEHSLTHWTGKCCCDKLLEKNTLWLFLHSKGDSFESYSDSS